MPRDLLKQVLPQALWVGLRSLLYYLQRLQRWGSVLWQVRGSSPRDQWVLVRSALSAVVTSARNLDRWQHPWVLNSCQVNVRGIGRFHLRPHCDDLWHVLPAAEPAVVRAMREFLKPGDVFVDAGANIGIYTVLAAKLVGSRGKVVSIEMMPDTFERLRTHVELNDLHNVNTVNLALSDVAGESVIATVEAERCGQATISRGNDRFGKGLHVHVLTGTLDEICTGLDRVNFMKIDLEGAEALALKSARATLARTAHVVFESWLGKATDESKVRNILQAAGFSLMQLDNDNWLARCER